MKEQLESIMLDCEKCEIKTAHFFVDWFKTKHQYRYIYECSICENQINSSVKYNVKRRHKKQNGN
jgi:hypothetical protein